MDIKIFLGKYRVSQEEIEAVGEFAGTPPAYEAEAIDSGKKVVVELIPAGSLEPATRERLEAEATAAKKLNHVNIPALYDFGVEDDHLVYVTEDFDGSLAEEWVNTHGPLPVGPVLRIASQVVSALGAAAFHQIVHHAINPGNLMLIPGQTPEGEWPMVKVLHFVGAAPKLSDTGGPVAAFDKSLHYVSPEQIQKGTVDFRSEIYSLGGTMWFLLTGVPPLVSLKEAIPVTPATTGGKVRAMPKKVRRLLAQMLAANPEMRPGDPLEFYRKLQECLLQVERREAISRRLGVVPISQNSDKIMGPRRRSVKALAMATLFLALAAVAGLAVSGYLRHRHIVRAEEPIGVPIGVPNTPIPSTATSADVTTAIASNSTQMTSTVANQSQSAPPESPSTVASATPGPSDTTTALASNSTQTTSTVAQSSNPQSASTEVPSTGASVTSTPVGTTNEIATNSAQTAGAVAQSNYPPSAPVNSAESDTTALSRAPDSAGRNQVAIQSAQPPGTNSVSNPPAQQSVPAAANSTNAATGSSEADSVGRTEAAPPPTQSSGTVAQHHAPKKSDMPEVRRAKPVEPEVRRAEPAPPAEDPEGIAPGTTSQAQTEESRDVETGTATGRRTDSEPKVTSRSRAKSQRYAGPRRSTNERIYTPQPTDEFGEPLPRSQRRSIRARFVGVTPDGMWIMRLPSNRIIVVPPPRTLP